MEETKGSVVITGASRGIGRRIALSFARRTDYPLLLVARSRGALLETRDLCRKQGAAAIAVADCDLTDLQAVEDITLPSDFPTPQILVNNAGSFLLKPLEKTTPDEFHSQIQANLYSAVHLTNRFLGDLKARPSALIVNICSEGALAGLKDSGAYSASKHALLGYTRSLRQELMATEIAITAINLGQTQSTSWKGSSIEADRLIDPDGVAELILTLAHLSPRTVVEEMLVKPKHGRVPPM